MDIFKEVKKRASILDVCNLLNIKLNKNNMCLCVFHNEKTPSFSVSPSKNIFYCFGCEKKGDSITLVSELLNISPLEAAMYINESLGLGIEIGIKKNRTREEKKKYDAALTKYNQMRKFKIEFLKWENETYQLLCDYLHQLGHWKELKNIDDERYVEALQQMDMIEFYIDEIFINGSLKDKEWFKNTNGKVVERIGRRLGK